MSDLPAPATTVTPISLAAGAMERYCDNLGIPMPSPGLAVALATVAAPHIAAAEREQIRQLARDCGATGRGADGPAEPFDDLIDRYRHDPRVDQP